MTGSVRDEVFSRRGGLYFGIAHLLDYPAPLRPADLSLRRLQRRPVRESQRRVPERGERASPASRSTSTATWSRPAATRARPGSTEAAVRSLGPRLDLSDAEIRRALEQEGPPIARTDPRCGRASSSSPTQAGRRPVPRAVLPRIRLQSPKITRPLTTEWFARRVDERYQRCLTKGG